MSITALLYNWGFFTMLGFAPFPMGLSAIQLGFVFFGWGLLVAFFSVIGAPRLQARFGTARSLYAALGLFAVDLLVMSIWADRLAVLIATVVVSGAFIGINNTLTTQAVMLVSPVERPVASAAYGFVRFLGGGLAPFAAGKLAEHFGIHVPFAVGAVAVVAAVLVLSTGHRMLAAADAGLGQGRRRHRRGRRRVRRRLGRDRQRAPARRRTSAPDPYGGGMSDVQTEVDGDVWRITLDRPERRQRPHPRAGRGARRRLLGPAGGDPGGPAARQRPAVLRRRGRAALQHGRGPGRVRRAAGPRLARGHPAAARHARFPVVAGVHGAVAGAGLGLIGACDVVVCARGTKLRPAYGAIGSRPTADRRGRWPGPSGHRGRWS